MNVDYENDDILQVNDDDIAMLAAVLNEYGYDKTLRYMHSSWLLSSEVTNSILKIVAEEGKASIEDIKSMKPSEGNEGASEEEVEKFTHMWLRKNFDPKAKNVK